MAIRVVRLGTPRQGGEGVRLGTVRRPPRGVRKEELGRRDYFDVWVPELAPSAPLVSWALSPRQNFSVGCYCEDKSQCHRSVLRELLRKAGAVLVPDS